MYNDIYMLLLMKFSCFLSQLGTFPVDAPHTTVRDLTDGVAMAEVLCQM